MNAQTIFGGGVPARDGRPEVGSGFQQQVEILPASALCAECSDYGAHESPSWFLRIGTAVVVVGVGFCALKFFGVM